MDGDDGSILPPRRIIRLDARWFFMLFLTIWMMLATSVFIEGFPSAPFAISELPAMALDSGLSSMVLLVLVIPLWAIGLGIGSIPPFRPWRIRISLVLPLIVALYAPVCLWLDHFNPAARFQQMTGTALPVHAHVEHVSIQGVMMADITDAWVLEAPTGEMDSLISGLGLTRPETTAGHVIKPPDPAVTRHIPEWETFEEWLPGQHRFAGPIYYLNLHINPAHTRAYIVYGNF